MPKKKTTPTEEVSEETTPESVDNVNTTTGSEIKETTTSGKTRFEVYNPDGGFVRAYTLEDHGEDAEKLANQFASHTGGIIK